MSNTRDTTPCPTSVARSGPIDRVIERMVEGGKPECEEFANNGKTVYIISMWTPPAAEGVRVLIQVKLTSVCRTNVEAAGRPHFSLGFAAANISSIVRPGFSSRHFSPT
jgi:hypothetical protein